MTAERLQVRAIAYEPQFDQRIGLKASYLSRQIDTFLGERLNVLLSKNKYEIKNDLIYGQDMDEPFIEVIRRGIEYRSRIEGENRADKKREQAEAEGFLKIQEVMCNPNTPAETIMLSVSPQGEKRSLYKHNFYDIFTLKELDGKRFIEARRYSSALSIYEYKDKLKPLCNVEGNIDDAYFLSHPVEISNNSLFENADQVHSYLHKNHKITELEEFKRIIKTCERLKQEYIKTPNPKILDAIMNKADEEAGLIEMKKNNFYDAIIGASIPLRAEKEIDYYGSHPVREVATGCGSSGSLSGNKKSSPFSVSDFGLESDKFGSREFECPECGKTNLRPKDELIKNCQHCGSSKVAC